MRKTFLVVASVALAMVVLGGVAWAANIKCPNAGFERHPTTIGEVKIALCNGTEKADTMRGTKKYADRMSGKSGADTMFGRGKFDSLSGGPGPDKIYGGQGFDHLFAGAGVDRLYGREEEDHIFSGNTEGSEDGRQIDLTDDYYYGGDGDDAFGVGGVNGVDRVNGGTGDDHIFVAGNAATGAKEIVECGPGTEDFVRFDEGVDVVNDTCEIKDPRPF
jgi:Ca2+-binding RTX toxin-like protein